jgi:hypothetical protein
MSLEAGNWKWSSRKVCIFVRLKPELTPSQGVDAQPPSHPHFAWIIPSHLPCIATCSLPTLPCTKEDSRATTGRRSLASVMISLTLSASYIEISEQVESFCLQSARHIVSLETANLIPGVSCPHNTHFKALPARLSAAHSTTLPAILLSSHILQLHHTPGPTHTQGLRNGLGWLEARISSCFAMWLLRLVVIPSSAVLAALVLLNMLMLHCTTERI